MDKKIICTVNAPKAIGPYSQAISTGELIFISGQLGIDPLTSNMKVGVKDQAIQAIQNLQNILKEADSTLSDVVKTTVFLKDMKDFSEVNKIYAQFFTEPYPSRSAIQIAELPMQGLIEIEAIALASK